MTNWSEADLARHQARQSLALPTQKESKYRNVRVQVDGIWFDSKKEARIWGELKLREKAGEIWQLQHHAPRFPLLAPLPDRTGSVVVAEYEPDFTFREHTHSRLVVMDAKGTRTTMYRLKKKWLLLQDGIEIREV